MNENETYAAEGDLTFMSYHPNKLKVGMYFIHPINVGVINPIIELFQLAEVPEDQEAFMVTYGAPVKLFIMSTEDAEILAYPEQIGWYDDNSGGQMEDEVPLSIEHINTIINKCGGICWVDIDEDDYVTLHKGKAIISFDIPNDEDDDDD